MKVFLFKKFYKVVLGPNRFRWQESPTQLVEKTSLLRTPRRVFRLPVAPVGAGPAEEVQGHPLAQCRHKFVEEEVYAFVVPKSVEKRTQKEEVEPVFTGVQEETPSQKAAPRS